MNKVESYCMMSSRVASRDSRDREISRNWSFISRSRNKSNLENSREMKNVRGFGKNHSFLRNKNDAKRHFVWKNKQTYE